jgi:hypothetical protein|tara:strand:- start:258 stop:572 length:315 start_codon:yes stop_codon:yes gene_type:complete
MKYVIDIDGTICNNTYGKYEEAVPFLDRIDKINKLHDEGHEIWYFTARGMSKNPPPSKATIQWYSLTKKQLEDWGCKYDHLYMGKPSADYYIDDKGISDSDFFK